MGTFPGSWTVGNDGGITTAKWGDNSAKYSAGSYSAFCADNGSNTRTVYDNNLKTYMERRSVSLAGYTTATLAFKYWLNTESGYDIFSVNVRDQAGSWHTLFTDSGNDSGLGWQTKSINLNAYAGQTDLYIQFRFDSDNTTVNASPSGVWVDEVALTADVAANSPPNQPTFNSVPSIAKIYPYTYPSPACGPYTVIVDYTDPNGASDLQHAYLQIKGDGTAQTIMYYNMTTPQQWSGEGDHLYNIGASKTSITNGYRVTYTFQIKSTWTPSLNVDFDAWAMDDSNAESTHRANNWNGVYDNALVIADARKGSLVDNDGDGYYSSVKIEADANSSVSSRTAKMILYRRDSSAGGSGADVWNTDDYTTSGTAVDFKGTDCTVPYKGVYDFAWELYDPSWYIVNRWYDVDADVSNLQMESAEQDIAYTINGTIDFPNPNSLRWNKIDWGWNAGLLARNATTNAGVLTLAVEPTTGLGAQIVHDGHSFGYYSAHIKTPPATTSPNGACQGFFYYRSDTEEIDVELLSAKSGYAYFTVQGGETFRVAVANQSTQYHEYGFDWSSTSVRFYLDGVLAVGDRVIAGGSTGPDVVLQSGVQAIAVNNIPQLSGALIINHWSGNSWAGYPPTSRLEMNVADVTWPEENRPPTDISLSASSIKENVAANSTVGTLSTTDPDAGNTFTYTLVSGAGSNDNASFTISGSTLQTAASFNYEAKSSYSVRIRTTDQGGLWYEEAFTITVSNVNETPTDVALSNSTVPENQPSGTTVGTLSTTDPDAGNTFTYTLVSGAGSTDNASFTISGSTLQTAASFNYESKSNYSVRIRTTDQGSLSNEKMFAIIVTNANETPTTPSNVSPLHGATNQPLTLTLYASAFNDPDNGDTHTATQWIIRRLTDGTVIMDSGEDVANKTSLNIPSGALANLTTYGWQVRYKDSCGTWSSYSTQTTFTTLLPSLTALTQGTNIVLSWSTDASDFILVSATNLSTTNWVLVSPSPVIVDGRNTVTNGMIDDMRFYRIVRHDIRGNQPPTLNALGNITLIENAGLQMVSLSGITSGAATEVQTLTVTAYSSNSGLIPNPTVSYTNPNSTGMLWFTPVANASGSATISVIVNDGQTVSNIITRTFTATVIAVNYPPHL